ncbi:hypothetical protein MRB53_036522 [Persea americana]|nr:hypothetical protein MRB53_037218 [Persea americana]KAJ8613843.1 hypothetical protein MRB53_036800 [Persea americana]KAJ8614656.1 hypothetical protein MRB53_036522 [Persea americana]
MFISSAWPRSPSPRLSRLISAATSSERSSLVVLPARIFSSFIANGSTPSGPARDVDLGTNSPSAPSASLTASLVGTAEMRGLVSVDVTATKVELSSHMTVSAFGSLFYEALPSPKSSYQAEVVELSSKQEYLF